MTYAHVDNGTVTVARLPASARRTDTGQWVMGLATAPVELRRACGWYEVIDADRPADTPTHTYDRSVQLVNGTPTVVWTQRAKTADELAAQTADANRAAIEAGITQHLTDLAAIANSSGTLTAAQLSNAVRVLARGQRRILRVLHNRLDATD